MGQKKGQTGNPKGRTAGTPNKLTADMKEKVQLFIESNFDQIQADFKLLEPRERVTLYERMLKYIIPQKVESQVEIQDNSPLINISIAGIDMNLNE